MKLILKSDIDFIEVHFDSYDALKKSTIRTVPVEYKDGVEAMLTFHNDINLLPITTTATPMGAYYIFKNEGFEVSMDSEFEAAYKKGLAVLNSFESDNDEIDDGPQKLY